MAEQLTPEAAREALAAANQMSRAGGRRSVWPRWAILVEALGLAALMVAASLLFSHPGLATGVFAAVVLAAGIFFRHWRISASGGLAKPTWVDGALITVFAIGFAAAMILPKYFGIAWAPFVIAPAYVVLRVLRYELGQRPLAKPVAAGPHA